MYILRPENGPVKISDKYQIFIFCNKLNAYKKPPSYVSITNKRVTVMHPFKAKMNLKCVSDQPNNKS